MSLVLGSAIQFPVATCSIIRDVDSFIYYFLEHKVPVSDKAKNIPVEHSIELNQLLSHTITIKNKRILSSCYPYVQAIYMLLVSCGFLKKKAENKKQFFTIDSELLQKWQGATEEDKYINLFLTWVLFSNYEVINKKYRTTDIMGSSLLFLLRDLFKKDMILNSYKKQKEYVWNSESYVILSLLHMFHFIDIQNGETEEGKGWLIKKITLNNHGGQFINLLKELCSIRYLHDFFEETDSNCLKILEDVKDMMSQKDSFFLQPKYQEPKQGKFLLKISLYRDFMREVVVDGDSTMEDLAYQILDLVNFDYDHLYEFRFINMYGEPTAVSDSRTDSYFEGNELPAAITLGELPVYEGEDISFIYDFGEHWEFKISILKINDDKLNQHENYKVLKKKGRAPQQYKDW